MLIELKASAMRPPVLAVPSGFLAVVVVAALIV
jgi:hypothetical protein